MYITLDIDLTAIPREKIVEARNGHKYLKAVLTTMRQEDKFGNDLTMYVAQSKEERAEKADRQYIGKGKTWEEREERQPKQPVNDFPKDLAF